MLPKLSWEQVVLFLGVFLIAVGGAVTLLILNKDVAALLTLVAFIGLPVLTAAGAVVSQKLDQVKQISNGNLSRAMDIIQDKHEENVRLALKLPADTDPADVLKPVSPGSAPTAVWPTIPR